MRFDKRLRISADLASGLEATGFGPAMQSVVMSPSCPAPLPCVSADGEPFVRAATGDEPTDTLTPRDVEPGDRFEWLGDVR